VIAEGIETIHQLTELRDLGADLGQGYYFTKPLAADEVAGLAARGLVRERQ
jgi:EAL domain-containing protein (putative c-di-GMP-specific phosphodiesterase class I)